MFGKHRLAGAIAPRVADNTFAAARSTDAAVNANRVFISYRRDDAAGYAGRLEDSLERRIGRGSVFRDVLDIAPGEDFAAAIRTRLAQADTVLVLIGPDWAGGEQVGQRRIDDTNDFVHLEVALALQSTARVVPVLLGSTAMPSEASLPQELKALAQRNAMNVGDVHWEEDVDRLALVLRAGQPKRKWRWPAVAALTVAALASTLFWWRSAVEPAASDAVLGAWQGTVRYDWGDSYDERFEFKRHAGEITGTATFLKYPRAITKLRFDGTSLHFETHSLETLSSSSGESTKELTHAYAAELQGPPAQQVLSFRLQTSGGHSSLQPIEFTARRIANDAAGAPVR